MRTFLTVVIAFAVTGILPLSAFFGIRHVMARMITRDTAGVVFDQFQATLDKGNIFIHDRLTAVSVADRAYREFSKGPPVDGWTNTMRISATVKGNSCELQVRSAGPDGAFGTADDLAMQRTFDLSPRQLKQR